MTTAWEHADVFPVIARIIETGSVESGSAYVTHDQITSSLMSDTEGSTLISAARDELDEDRTAEWIAHNMVAWFSQRITVGESDWAGRFDRQKIDGKWAYRPKSSNP
jgi:hypothetical protein